MRGITVLALVLIGATAVLSAATPQKGAAGKGGPGNKMKGPGDHKAGGNKPGNKVQVLRTEPTIYATGNTGAGACVPAGTMYYTTTDNKLIRSDPAGSFKKVETQIADNVAYSFNGYDDGLWYVDTEGKVWRVHYQGKPEVVPGQPDGVKFARVSPRTYDETYAVTQDNRLFHYVAHEWIEDENAKNARDSGTGYGGSAMYVDTDSKIFKFDFKQNQWVPYEKNGKGFDIYDVDTVVVFDDKGNAEKRVNGTWVPVTESKCNDVFINVDSFVCISPDKHVKLIPY
ncbi:uncharacterized protein LOC129593156 [Paramacrobiotus metropolitanus]|uniref:uncharacterized protein LOC129593156 n=1 Tax=Paramacrobiotus metropolitanus TaxID=2943436 RepID=UPI0024463329|nr:uncharacterized protein LOC129593156 [Paramacrobiotus metropolitanus]